MGLSGSRPPSGAGGSNVRGTPRDVLERPSTAKGTDTPENVQRYLEALAARALNEDPAAVALAVRSERQAGEVEKLQKASRHATPGVNDTPGVERGKLNRQLRRASRRRKKTAKVVAEMIERARIEGADPNWKPEAFPALDWRIRSEVWSVMRDVSGKKARIFCGALPPPQAEQLVKEAERIAQDLRIAEGYATLRWRELVAGAWVSWRLSRPVRTRSKTKDSRARAQLGDEALGYVPPDPDDLAPPIKRTNPWAGGRVVDGYARQAFALLMQDVRTGECMSISKLFYTNGSGELGVFSYLSARGALSLYSRWQPPAWKSKYVGPAKRGSDGKVLLDRHGKPQRYALSEHWYHRDMCGRRAAAQADRGKSVATGLLRTLCPWLFADDKTREKILDELAQLEAATAGGIEPPCPALSDGATTAELTHVEPPD